MGFLNPLKTRNLQKFLEVSNWVQGLDLNQRPSGYEDAANIAHRDRLRPDDRSMPWRAGLTDFEKKPRPSLCLVDPGFDETRRRDVAVFIAEIMRRPQANGKLLIIFMQLSDHVRRGDVFRIVIEYSLHLRDLAD